LRTLHVTTTVTQSACKAIEFGEITQNKGYYAIQGHSRSPISVPIERPYATSYQWLILTDILSHTISKLSQFIVYILVTLHFSAPPLWGEAYGHRTLFILESLESSQ